MQTITLVEQLCTPCTQARPPNPTPDTTPVIGGIYGRVIVVQKDVGPRKMALGVDVVFN
jgi:hypothetical protein